MRTAWGWERRSRGSSRESRFRGRALGMWGLLASVCFSDAVHGYGPGCPYPNPEPVVLTSGDYLFISMKWCGITEAPSVNAPASSLPGCTNPGDDPLTFKGMLWRRHERASDAIFIPQCRITLRSGGTVHFSQYLKFNDLDTSVGAPGDIVVEPDDAEMYQTWHECDELWGSQTKGIIAVSVRRLINTSGESVWRAASYVGSFTAPYLAANDPTEECQLNERSLAHEVGHILTLQHSNSADNLMESGGLGAEISTGQCNSMRNHLDSNTLLDPPGGLGGGGQARNLVDFVFDTRRERGVGGKANHLDIRKVVAIDDSASGGDLSFYIGTEGLMPRREGQVTTYWIALDTDNDPATGADPFGFFPGRPMRGVELIAQIQGEGERVAAALFAPNADGRWVAVELGRLVLADIRDISLVCDPLPSYRGPSSFPKFSEVGFRIDSGAFARLRFPAGGRLFPRGLRLQAAASMPGVQAVDLAPDEGGVLEFPEIVFPSIAVQGRAARGEVVPVVVDDMTPEVGLMLFLGRFAIGLDARTDRRGHAEFEFVVPAEAPLGPTLLTVGVGDPSQPDNAVTADTVLEVVGRRRELFVRGDADADGVLNLTDAIRILSYLFRGGPAPECLDAADVNDDGGRRPDITDVVSLLDWLFRGTTAPRPPTPSAAEYAAADCGIDPTPDDAMDCSLSAARCQ